MTRRLLFVFAFGSAVALLSSPCAATGFESRPLMQAEKAYDAPEVGQPEASDVRYAAAHTMTGTLKSVDVEQGIVEISAKGQDMRLHFPSHWLFRVQQGDTVTISLAFAEITGDDVEHAYDVPVGREKDLHLMKGTVNGVDHETGLIDFHTADMDLRLHFPPGTLNHVQQSDRIAVRVGLQTAARPLPPEPEPHHQIEPRG